MGDIFWPNGYNKHTHLRDYLHMHVVILEFWKGTVCDL